MVLVVILKVASVIVGSEAVVGRDIVCNTLGVGVAKSTISRVGVGAPL
jgi:hypothetical protein